MTTTPAPAPVATVPGCPHIPQCPAADAVDHDAAHVVFHDYAAGISRLCNGVLIFDDTGELVGTAPVAPHRPEPRHCTNPDHPRSCCADDVRWAAVDAAGRAFEAETKDAA